MVSRPRVAAVDQRALLRRLRTGRGRGRENENKKTARLTDVLLARARVRVRDDTDFARRGRVPRHARFAVTGNPLRPAVVAARARRRALRRNRLGQRVVCARVFRKNVR